GTVSSAGKFLKEKNPQIRVVAGDPVGSIYTGYARTHKKGDGQPYKVEGIGGDKIPTSLHWDVIDEWVVVSDKDAMQMARRLSKEEGLFVGGSTGVNVVAALDVARRSDDPTALVVTVLADTGERYLSKVYNEEWLRENQLIDDSRPTVARLVAAKTGDAPPLIHVAPEASVRQALNLMTTYNVSQLPVIEADDGIGAVSEQALMARAIGQPKILDSPVREVMDPPFPVVDSHSPVAQLTMLLSRTTPAALGRRARGWHTPGRARRHRRALHGQRAARQRARHGQGPRQAPVSGDRRAGTGLVHGARGLGRRDDGPRMAGHRQTVQAGLVRRIDPGQESTRLGQCGQAGCPVR